MTDREKIIETLRASGYGYFITHKKANADEALADTADALIANGIGDVSEWKDRAKKHRVQILPDGAIKQLYSDEEVEQIVKDRDEWKRRAEAAERAVREYAVQVGCRRCPFYGRCGIACPTAMDDYKECYEAALRVSAREIEEKLK